MRDECSAVMYCFPDLGLVGYCGVSRHGWNCFACRKLCTLDSYSWVDRINRELPLSARVIIVMLFFSLDCMVLIVLASGYALWVGWWLLFCCRMLMRSATSFLYTSGLDVRRCDMVVSASTARFCNQFCCLVCRLCLGPFCSRNIS